MGRYRSVYIVLTKTNTVFARLIRLYTNDEYSHASLSLDKNLRKMYSFGRKYEKNPFIGAFLKEDINKGVFGMFDCIPCMILKIDVTKEQYQNIEELINYFNCNKEIFGYNRRGLICNMMNKPKRVENRYFCSEFVYYVLNESGVIDLKKSCNLIKPQDFLYMPFEIIYQGNLHKYQ